MTIRSARGDTSVLHNLGYPGYNSILEECGFSYSKFANMANVFAVPNRRLLVLGQTLCLVSLVSLMHDRHDDRQSIIDIHIINDTRMYYTYCIVYNQINRDTELSFSIPLNGRLAPPVPWYGYISITFWDGRKGFFLLYPWLLLPVFATAGGWGGGAHQSVQCPLYIYMNCNVATAWHYLKFCISFASRM